MKSSPGISFSFILLFLISNDFLREKKQVKAADDVSMTGAQIETTKTFLKNFRPTVEGYSYLQMKWWLEDSKDYSQTPPPFPFCMVSSKVVVTFDDSSNCAKFAKVLELIENKFENFQKFNTSEHLTANNKKWIKDITLSRINTPEMDMVNLRNWMHIKIESAVPLQGLLVQALVGPTGLPLGQFNLEFPCKDDSTSANIADVGELCPCSMRPRVALQHPNVYAGYSASGRKVFHLHYSWTDLQCLESPYLQFLLLAVKDFNGDNEGKDYRPSYSPVYINPTLDGLSGAPYPYYPEWRDNMYCYLDAKTLDSTYSAQYPTTRPDGKNLWVQGYPSKKVDADPKFSPIAWKALDDKDFVMQSNREFFTCIFNDSIQGHDGVRLECPPGPLQCDKPGGGAGKSSDLNVEKERKALLDDMETAACGTPVFCDVPSCDTFETSVIDTTTNSSGTFCKGANDLINFGGVTAMADDLNAFAHMLIHNRLERRMSHGLMATLAFLVFLPIANFAGRFLKEVPPYIMSGNGPWLGIHILLYLLSMILLWLSVGPVMPQLLVRELINKECEFTYPYNLKLREACATRQGFKNPHVPFAIVAFVLFHVLIFSGFWRSQNHRTRKIQQYMHTFGGYLCWLLGGLSMIMASLLDTCFDLKFTSLSLLGLPVVATLIAQCMEIIEDLSLDIRPTRYFFPVMEPIKITKLRTFTRAKLAVAVLFCVLQLGGWVVTLCSYIKMNTSFKALSGLKSTIDGLFGLEGQCLPTLPPW